MNTKEFIFISQLLKVHSGLALGEDKVYLLESRLLPVAREYGCRDLSELIHFLSTKPEERMISEVVEAMTTNESMFFRDRKPFARLTDVLLPRLKAAGARSVRIWSAACASGQEPYSIAMNLLENAALLTGITTGIIASDISARILEKARCGIYSQFEVQRGLPISMLLRYFTQMPDNNWRVNDAVRAAVKFHTVNLLGNITALGKFDIIFCRNVLLYFDDETKSATLGKLSRMLNSGGILVLGSAETVLGYSDLFEALEGELGLYKVVN